MVSVTFFITVSYFSIINFYSFSFHFRCVDVFLVSTTYQEVCHSGTCTCLAPSTHIARSHPQSHTFSNSLFHFMIILGSTSGRKSSLSPPVFVRCPCLGSESILLHACPIALSSLCDNDLFILLLLCISFLLLQNKLSQPRSLKQYPFITLQLL